MRDIQVSQNRMSNTTKKSWEIPAGEHVGWPVREERTFNLQHGMTFKTRIPKMEAKLEAAHVAKINADYAKRLAGDPFYANHE